MYWFGVWKPELENIIDRTDTSEDDTAANALELAVSRTEYDRTLGETNGNNAAVLAELRERFSALVAKIPPEEVEGCQTHFDNMIKWLKKSGNMSCGSVPSMVRKVFTGKENYKKARIVSSGPIKVIIDGEEFYKQRYNPDRLVRAGQFIIDNLDRNRPVEARVITGHGASGFRKEKRRLPTHSLVITGYSNIVGSRISPQKVDFNALDPGNWDIGPLVLDVANQNFMARGVTTDDPSYQVVHLWA